MNTLPYVPITYTCSYNVIQLHQCNRLCIMYVYVSFLGTVYWGTLYSSICIVQGRHEVQRDQTHTHTALHRNHRLLQHHRNPRPSQHHGRNTAYNTIVGNVLCIFYDEKSNINVNVNNTFTRTRKVLRLWYFNTITAQKERDTQTQIVKKNFIDPQNYTKMKKIHRSWVFSVLQVDL